jgi:hypothetical protein
VYQYCPGHYDDLFGQPKAICDDDVQVVSPTLFTIEVLVDIIWLFEICFNFVKRTKINTDVRSIAFNYAFNGTFIFDVLATIPPLLSSESFSVYYFKCFRILHLEALVLPVNIILGFLLSNYSKKRQNDLTGFASLIFKVIYMCHILACIWLWLG